MTDPATVSYGDIAELLQRPLQSVYPITRQPGFPPPLPLGKRNKRWSRASIMAWIEANGHPDTPADNPLTRACRRAIDDPATPDVVRSWLQHLLQGDD